MTATPQVISSAPEYLLGKQNGHDVLVPARVLRDSAAYPAPPAGSVQTQVFQDPLTGEISSWNPVAGAFVPIEPVQVSARYFGFRSGELPSPRTDDQLAALAPDCSAAARNLEDWFSNWRERGQKIAVVRFDAGVYKFDTLTFRENSDVFYPRSGLILQGAGSFATTLQATVSSAAQFIGMDGQTNWIMCPSLRGLRLRGVAASNPYQVGVFLNPQFSSALGFGGLTRPDWYDVYALNFAREAIWLRGGASSYLVPAQYGVWDSVRGDSTAAAYPGVKLTGQVGPPFIFRNLEAYGTNNANSRAAYIGLDQRTGIPIASVSTSENCLVFSEPHRLTTTDPFKVEGGTAWGGLTAGTKYWVVRLDDFRLRVCTSLANAQANPPVVVTLTSQTGTATGTSFQEASIDTAAVQTVLDTPTFSSAAIGLDVTAGSVDIRSAHVEETDRSIVVSGTADVLVDGADIGNGGRTGAVFDASSSTSSAHRLTVQGRVTLKGTVTKIAADYFGNVDLRAAEFVGNYPTVGSGVTGKMLGLLQLGNAAEIDLGSAVREEYLLNTGTTTTQHIKGLVIPGRRVTFRAWSATGNWLQFGNSGNLYLAGADANANLLRIPVGSTATFTASAVNEGWTLTALRLPTHSASWTVSGNVSANSSVSTTVTCAGARVGDPAPAVSLSVALTAGLILVGEVTATDTVTVRIVNPTAGALAGPTNPTVYVRQTR